MLASCILHFTFCILHSFLLTAAYPGTQPLGLTRHLVTASPLVGERRFGYDDRMEPDLAYPPAPGGAVPFSAARLAVWLPAAIVLGGLAGGAAAVCQTYFSPAILFPLLVGFVLGGMLVGLMRLTQTAHRKTVYLGTLLALAAAVFGEHYGSYQWEMMRVRRAAEKALGEKNAAFLRSLPPDAGTPLQPVGFWDFLRHKARDGRPVMGESRLHGRLAWLSWALDGLLMLAAAAFLVVPATRQPYCGQCRTWYHTIRAGRVNMTDAHRLAESAAMEAAPDRCRRVHYRLTTCDAGCGLTGFELWWYEAKRVDRGPRSLQVWLDHDRRNQVTTVLDELAAQRRKRRSPRGLNP